MNEIIIASTNKGKIEEFKALLNGLDIEVKSMQEVLNKTIDIKENGSTFKENALLKAQTISKMINGVVLADDSGLVIDALDGKPGIESARFLGHDTSYVIKNNCILEMMRQQKNRNARFVCAIAIIIPNKEPILIEETFEGEIAHAIEGENGFGYDPIFYYPPLQKTSASMTLEEKNQYSHRAKALKKAVEVIKKIKGE
ncbi:MAG: RdgB/HAM1 family non-canonical purine NTP pyrophosphatase [Erysipelotrichaceae bacterium]|nr:RdgB/HAM1 family non-canonical purine NTP pyrophosphatase [Erysipelotrichaceae bacterium]